MYSLVAGACLATLLLCACIELERSVEVTPQPLPTQVQGASWPETPVSYCIVRDDEGGYVSHDTFVALTREAMEAWQLPTTFEGDCPGPITSGNGINEIGWGDLPGEPATLTEAGQTNTRYQSRPGGGAPDIIEADITIERQPASGKDTEDCLYTTLLHEAGHLFGVPHLAMSNVMGPVTTECLQELTPADREALEELY